MGFVLNEMECRKAPNSHHFVVTLGEGVTLEARLFGPDALLQQGSPRTLSFLHMAYLAAAARGQSLDVNCQVSEVEWNLFMFSFVPLVNDYYDLPKIRVSRLAIQKAHVPVKSASPHAALLFSGGVDSFYSLFKIKEARRGPHCLVNINAGAYSNKEEWAAAFGNLDQVASKTGLPVLFIDTNFQHIFPKPHIASHTIRNISAASLLSGLVSTLFYSGSETFRDVNYVEGKKTSVMSLVEPLLLNGMQRQDLAAVVFGSDADRIRKTADISTSAVVQSHLDVCTSTRYQVTRGDGPLNCGRCMKCLRTMFTLDALGALDKFGGCFPVANFRARTAELFGILESGELSLDRDVVAFWQEVKSGAVA